LPLGFLLVLRRNREGRPVEPIRRPVDIRGGRRCRNWRVWRGELGGNRPDMGRASKSLDFYRILDQF
jgi:hypothetical protein